MNRVLYQLSYAAIYYANSEKVEISFVIIPEQMLFVKLKINFFGHTVRGGITMRIWKQAVLFCVGGGGYVCLELLWRGRSHGSMFFLGGLCFWIIGFIRRLAKISLSLRLLLSAACVTVLELLTGLAVNREYAVWDYRGLPFHYRGQICLIYSLLWLPVCFLGMMLHSVAEQLLTRQK